MNQEEQQFCIQPPQQEYVEIAQLFPANPIYEKLIRQSPKPGLKVEIIKNEQHHRQILRPVFKQESESEQDDENVQLPNDMLKSPINKHYETQKLFYLKYSNREMNSVNGFEYFASRFIDRKLFKATKQQLKTNFDLHRELFNEEINSQYDIRNKNQIFFDSNFESGNLFAVYRKALYQFDLVLENDINSKGNTQWFYFSIKGLPKEVDVTFNIVNLMKSDSLFNYGMQPVVFSEQRSKRLGEGWERIGKSISYSKNSIKRENSRRFYYTLSFKLTAKYANDTIYVAHCFPYTYKTLNDYLMNVTKPVDKKKPLVARQTIGKTIANNPIQCLTITQIVDSKKKQTRKIIVIMARQHPGESQGSFVCEGMINYLLGKTKQAEFLRKNFIIKIIPMVNPDGVIFGNYRTNLMGLDLNRRWDTFDKDNLVPEVSCIKAFISDLNKEKRVRFILDLHGHSKKLNSFFYGNPYPPNPEVVRGFPFSCSKLNNQISYEDCTFTIEQQKKKAARVYLSMTHQLTNVYTYESSFYGYIKDNKKVAFGIQDFKNLGTTLCQALHSFLEYDFHVDTKTIDKYNGIYLKHLNQLKQNATLMQIGNQDASASDNNPQQYELKESELNSFIKKTEQIQTVEATKDASMPNVLSQPNTPYVKNEIKYEKKPSRTYKQAETNRIIPVAPEKFSTAALIHQIKRKEQQIQQELEGEYYRYSRSMKIFKSTNFTQTDFSQLEGSQDIRSINFELCNSERFIPVRPPSSNIKDNYTLKYVSLITQKCKKNMILKLDLTSKPVNQTRRNDKMRNSFTQTFISFFKQEKPRVNSMLPTVDSAMIEKEVRQAYSTKLKFQLFKQKKQQPQKPQNQDFLNEMVKKYLVDLREKHKSKSKNLNSYQDRSLYERSQQERPLSIKKKQIIKKGSTFIATKRI